VHRLARMGIQLIDYSKGGVMVQNNSESSFVADVKAKQGLVPNFGGIEGNCAEKGRRDFLPRGRWGT